MESQPQNPEFRNNPENFHPCLWPVRRKLGLNQDPGQLCFGSVCRKLGLSWDPGQPTQSVTCLATDESLTADPGLASSIPAWSHTFVEIDYEIISVVILLPSAESFKKGCGQLQAKVCARRTG